MIKRLNKDGAGIATIIILLIVVVIIAGAGVAVYVAVSGSNDNSNDDDNTPTISGPGLGSAYVYKTADGKSTLTTELLGENANEYIYNIKGLTSSSSTSLLTVNKSSGIISDVDPIRTTGSGDDKVQTWTVEFGTKSTEISIKKVDGTYNISEIKINGSGSVTYVINTAESTVKAPSGKAPSNNIGESLEYTTEINIDMGRILGEDFIIKADGKITITRLADAADGKYVFSTTTDIKYTWPSSLAAYVPPIYQDEYTTEYYISSDVDYELTGLDDLDYLNTLTRTAKTIAGPDGSAYVYEYSGNLHTEIAGVVSDTSITVDIGVSDGILYHYSINTTSAGSNVNIHVMYVKHTHH
ncbi:MAG: hypothetical protein LBV63_00315 [Candidatus Methanoplasma sp.]|jgi:hypothetical protein|nr:hypothetical protein [Candidatus Methanoplasma sp.]